MPVRFGAATPIGGVTSGLGSDLVAETSVRFGAGTPMGGVGSARGRGFGGGISARFGAATPIGGVSSGLGSGFGGGMAARFGAGTPIGGVTSSVDDTVNDGVGGVLKDCPRAILAGVVPIGGVADGGPASFDRVSSAWAAGGRTVGKMMVPIRARRVGGSSFSPDESDGECHWLTRLRAWNAAKYRSSRLFRSGSGALDIRPIQASRLCSHVLSAKPSARSTSASGRPASTSAQRAANSSISISGSIRIGVWGEGCRRLPEAPNVSPEVWGEGCRRLPEAPNVSPEVWGEGCRRLPEAPNVSPEVWGEGYRRLPEAPNVNREALRRRVPKATRSPKCSTPGGRHEAQCRPYAASERWSRAGSSFSPHRSYLGLALPPQSVISPLQQR
jgi:hypothetical protein